MSNQGENAGNVRTYTMSKVFIDTNILIYSLDGADPNKQNVCRAVIKELSEDLNHGQVVRGVRIENPILTSVGGG
jgi:predicted nucleic acid-binding protein